jgi:hypothetical protein
VHSDVRFLVALAYREYETWFLAAARSLRGVSGLPADLSPPLNPETIRDAKGWLDERMPHGYDPVRHQRLFTERFSFDEASRVPSFARLQARMPDILI